MPVHKSLLLLSFQHLPRIFNLRKKINKDAWVIEVLFALWHVIKYIRNNKMISLELE